MNRNRVTKANEPVTGQSAGAGRVTSRSQRAIRGEGAGVQVLERVQRAHPNDPKAQIAKFFREFVIKAGTGRARPVSERTNDRYQDGLCRMVDDLRTDRAAIRNLREIGRVHALRLIKFWFRQGQATNTIQNKISILRRFLTFIGKPHVVPRAEFLTKWLKENGVEVSNWASTVAAKSKAWDENGVEFGAVLELVESSCPITRIQLELQAAFGLRMKESIQLNPQFADHGNLLRVIHGTKGGLPRDIRFEDDEATRVWQRDVLDRAKLLSACNRKGTVSLPGLSLEQSKSHFYWELRKAGVTKKELGVTAHGLRHQYAARRYARVAKMDAPVSQSAPQSVTTEQREADKLACRVVSNEMGHQRRDVMQAYVGSTPMKEQMRGKRLREWLVLTEQNPTFLRLLADAGVVQAWLGGRFAAGLETARNEPLRLFVATAKRQPLNREVRIRLRQALAGHYGRAIDLSEVLDSEDPGDGLELVLRPKGLQPTDFFQPTK